MNVSLQGFRTYPSFLHFLASVTFLSAYVSVLCIRGLVFAFSQPLAIVRYFTSCSKSYSNTKPFCQNEITPVHMLMLSFAGCVFTLVMGSFLGYHIYLVLCVLLPPSFLKQTPLTSKRSSFLPSFPSFPSSLSLPTTPQITHHYLPHPH